MERLIKSLTAIISSSSAMRSSAPEQLLGTVLEEVLKAVDGAVLGWVCLARGLSDHLGWPGVTALPHDSVYLAAVRHARQEVPLRTGVACPDCPCRCFLAGADPPPKYAVFDHCPHPTLCEPSAGAHACVPLFAQNAPLGVLNLAKAGSASFSNSEELFLQAIASQLSAALENANLICETQTRLRETQTLLDVSRSVNSSLDLQETVRRVARAIAGVLKADTVGAYLLDSDGAQLLPFAGYHVPKNLMGRIRRTPIPVKGFRLVEEGLNAKTAVYTTNSDEDTRVDHPVFRSFSIRSCLFVPMSLKETIVGGLFVIWWKKAHDFTAEEVGLVNAIARQTAIAIENARLFEEVQTHALALEASEAKYRLLAEHVRDVIYALDAEGRFTYVNPGVRAVLGYAPEELLSHCFTDILTATSRQQVIEIFAKAADGDDPFNFYMLDMEKKEGSVAVPFEIGMVTIRDATGQVAGWHGIARDVTERKQWEQQLLRTERHPAMSETASGIAHNVDNILGATPGSVHIPHRVVRKAEGQRGIEAIEKAALDEADLIRRPQPSTLQRQDKAFSSVDLNQVTPTVSEIPPAPQPNTTPSAKPARILVIDDDTMVRELLSEILQAAGHTVVHVGGGREGLRLFQQDSFDLVLTDLAMPECTGWEVASTIKKLAIKKLAPNIPVALVTGWGLVADRMKLKAAGVDLVLNKPFQVEEVLALVAEGLRLREKT